MRQPQDIKPVIWVGSSREDLKEFPDSAQDKIGRALLKVQYGSKPTSARVLSGFHGAGVLEIKADYDGDTYRAIYTVRFTERIYVLHVFQKKSRHGIQTAKQDIDLVQARLERAEAMHQEFISRKEEA